MLVLGLIPVFSKLDTRLSASAFSIAACALLVFDLMTFSYGYMGFAEAKEIFPQARSFDFLKQNTDPSRFRITEIGIPYTANANLVYGIPSADGYEVRLTRLHRALSLDYTESRQDGISFTGNGLLNFNDRRLDLLNVKHLVLETSSPEFERFKATDRFSLVFNDGNVAAFENKTVLPRAFLVPFSGLKVLPDIEDQLAVLRDPNVNPQFTVTVAQIPEALNEPTHPVGCNCCTDEQRRDVEDVYERSNTPLHQ
jgi:hypothetical protein